MPSSRLLSIVLIAGSAFGLNGAAASLALADPPDDDVLAAAPDDPASAPAPQPADAALPKRDSTGRVVRPEEPTVLAFNNVTVDRVVPFIVEATGKVVLPMPDIMLLRITILNDQKIPRDKALDMVFLALLYNGVAVIENHDIVNLRSVAELDKYDIPVVPGDDDIQHRSPGTIVTAIFSPRYSSATNLAEMFKTQLPSYAKMTFDPDSNQLVVTADVGLLQRMQRTLKALDQPAAAALSTETFHLRYADANDIAQNIRDLYAQQQGQNRAAGGNNNPFANFFNRGGQPGGGQGRQGGAGGTAAGGQRSSSADASTSQNLRVTANTQQNAVTVLAEKPVLEQIRKQIDEEWDILSEPITPHVYELVNTDPVKMRDVLISMFGSPGAQRQGGGGNQQQSTTANRLYGQFTFEAIPDAARLVVIAKNKSNLEAIDQIIQSLDKPQTAGLPQIIELKHAEAELLAEQLNALLSREGTLAQVTKSETGLNTSATSASPFATSSTTTTNQNTQNQQNSIYTFWWQRSQPPTTNAGSGNLVGKIRIVPVSRQNSLMILSPPEYKDSLRELITSLDNPGRQVLLSAVIAEINVEDATSLGLRWANSAITPSKSDNSISFGSSTPASNTSSGSTITGTKNDLLPGLFTSSVLNLGVNVNALIQALGEKTAVNILSEPRIFTSDNQQADFFSGQDIPFITQNQPATNNTSLVQSFDYRAVGIALRVRPRITINRDVDININLELSSTQPGNTLFGGAIVDRRETTTHLIVKDGQTVVVSGILRTEDNDTHRKIPILGDMPFGLGAPFNSIERTKKKTELICFVTPQVIGSETDLASADLTDNQRLKEVRTRLQPIVDLDRDKKKTAIPTPPPKANEPQ
jgi:type II secretion system protein D